MSAFKDHFDDLEEGDAEEMVEPEESNMSEVAGNDELNFLGCEEEHNNIEFISYNRISCFSHTLQLVVNQFEKVESFKALMKRAHLLVRKVNSSTKATERLVTLGRSLLKTVLLGGVPHS